MLTDEIFVKNNDTIYHVNFNDYIDINDLKKALKELDITKVEDIVNYINTLKKCESIHKSHRFSTIEGE